MPFLSRYAFAITVTVLTVALRWLIDPCLASELPLVTLFGAVAAASWLGGYRPAFVSAVSGYLACNYLFIEPRGSLGFTFPEDLVGLLAFLVSCSFIVGFGEALRRTRSKAKKSHDLLQITLASVGDAVIVTDAKGSINFINPVGQSVTGWSQTAATGQPLDTVFRALNEETRQPVENPALRALREGRIVGLANHSVLIRKYGTECPIDDSAAPIRDNRGNVSGCVLVFRDVTERRRAEQALQSSERQFRDLFDNANMALHWVSSAGIILRANQHELNLLGYAQEEYAGHAIAEFHEDRKVIDDILCRLAAGETLEEYPARLRCKDGSIKDVLISSNILWKDGKFIHARCFTRDVTEHKQVEQALRDSEERLRLAQQVARVGSFDWNLESGVNIWTPELEAMYGLPSGGFAKTQPAWESLVHPEDRSTAIAAVERALQTGEPTEQEWRVIWHDGSVHWIAARFRALTNLLGKPRRLIGVNIDITERKRAEESQALLAAIVADSDDAIVSKTLDGTIVSWNAAVRLHRRGGCWAANQPNHTSRTLG